MFRLKNIGCTKSFSVRAAAAFLAVLSLLFGNSAGIAGEKSLTVFSNPAAISPVDRPSNAAGTNPGLPPANYPSPIVVSGLSGTITKITVTFAITSTFPDDFDILLVGPTGAKSLVMSDAGGSGDHTNITYTFDQTAATTMPDAPTAPVPAGTFRPTNFNGLATPEPGGQDNFPTAGGLATYTANFNVFNGTNPNGTWNLYVVDDQALDPANSLPSGWSMDITTAGAPVDAPVDFNGDGRTDYAVVRNVGSGQSGQIRWFYNLNTAAPSSTVALDWGLASDFFVPEDYDNDGKDDIAIWRSGAPGVAAFYILNSATMTARVEAFGQSGDDPSIVGDYGGDNAADLAVYREGNAPGEQSVWYYRSTPGGAVTSVPWGITSDFPAQGDYDGDGKFDFAIQRAFNGQGQYWISKTSGGTSVTPFGLTSDTIVPGDYDGDGKTDIATARVVGSSMQWHYLSSQSGLIVYTTFGSATQNFLVPGMYDGDNKTDVAVYQTTTGEFVSLNSTNGAASWFTLGSNGDYPVANYSLH